MTMVDDFDDADALVQSMFSPDVFMPKSWSDFDKRWASLNRVGPDFVLEVMEASTAEEDQASPLPKFARRFGQHLHSFAWYVDADDHVPTFRRLQAGGVRVAGPAGCCPTTSPTRTCRACSSRIRRTPSARSSCGAPVRRHGTTRCSTRRGTATQWRDDQPLGIVRLATSRTRSTTSTGRSSVRRPPRRHGVPRGERRGRDRVYVLVGTDTVVELARPLASGTRLADDLATNGPLPHQATFQVQDLDAAVDAPRSDRHDRRRADRRHRRRSIRRRRSARCSGSRPPCCRTTRDDAHDRRATTLPGVRLGCRAARPREDVGRARRARRRSSRRSIAPSAASTCSTVPGPDDGRGDDRVVQQPRERDVGRRRADLGAQLLPRFELRALRLDLRLHALAATSTTAARSASTPPSSPPPSGLHGMTPTP